MAKEARKLKRAAARQESAQDAKEKRKALKQPVVARPNTELPDPLGREQLRSLGLRLGLPVAAVWLLGVLIAGVSQSTTTKAIALSVPAVATVAAAALVLWALRQAKRARSVASLLSRVESADDRKAALAELDSAKKKDAAAIFAKAQLEMQDDPRKALATLETINLERVMAPVADEARAQRAMIHLVLGEVGLARQLADNIDLKRHQDPKTRAMLASIVGEAWARSGQSKRAIETLELYDPEDDDYEQIRAQLYRARAYAGAHGGNSALMRRALRKLLDQDVRLLGGFTGKKTHPLLMKEARKLLEQSGQVPRKMVVQRRA
ncbi:MAG: hypothetical protein OZ921_09780 [Sorangiineae bacterium]|nr:hypothetical protein [Polyangiaceae bacterium]MEB2322793.1 hypothetical protein [Sorangiineae bacterium]